MPVQMAALAFVVRDAMTGIEFEAASNKHGETLLVGVWQGGACRSRGGRPVVASALAGAKGRVGSVLDAVRVL